MYRHTQTIARVGAGLTAIGALLWVLWPKDFQWSESAESIFVFSVAFVTWLLTEVKQSEEVVFRQSSPNDIRVSKELVNLHREEFRVLLDEHDMHGFIDYRYVQLLDDVLHRFKTEKLEFQNRRLQDLTNDFLKSAQAFRRYIAENTTPTLLGGQEVIGFKNDRIVSDVEFQRSLNLSETANDLGSRAWDRLESLVHAIKVQVPECLD
ncbi:MAG: hypothetical protein KBF78_17305 [Fuscovulum sp.]|nr:hypothetical protein [Fuscovulum sp.]